MWRDIPGLRAMGVSFDEVHTELIDRYVERVRPDMARGPAPAIVAALAGRGVPQAAEKMMVVSYGRYLKGRY